MEKKTKVFLTDDHAILRAGLKSLVDREPTMKVVGEASDGEELMEKLERTACDVVVLDISMPNMDGLAALQRIRKEYPKVKILVLTMQKDTDHFKKAMDLKASGYLLKDDAFEQLSLAIRLIVKGKTFVSPSMSSLVTQRYLRQEGDDDSGSVGVLTAREKQILQLIASGLPNKTIAARLKLSVRTVETHRSHLSNKLGLRNTAQLVKFAMAKGMI